MPAGVSKEAWWRDQRYKFFNEATTRPIITAHHLDDVVENWIFTSMNGNPFLIPHQRDQFIRPFLTTEKNDLRSGVFARAFRPLTIPATTTPSIAATTSDTR